MSNLGLIFRKNPILAWAAVGTAAWFYHESRATGYYHSAYAAYIKQREQELRNVTS